MPLDVCGDPDRDWYPTRRVCWPTAVLKAAQELYGQQHEKRQYHSGDFTLWAEERSFAFPFHAFDGVSIGLSEEEQDTSWLTGVSADVPTAPDPSLTAAEGGAD